MSRGNVNWQLETSGVGLGLRKVAQNIALGDFAVSTTGTLNLTQKIPAGSFVIGSKVNVLEGFAGDTTATLDIGHSGDVDAFAYAAHNVVAAGNNKVQPATGKAGNADGTGIQAVASETTVLLTLTGTSDVANMTGGKAEVEVFYLSTNPEMQNDYPKTAREGF